jgi:hypothetical protein
MDFNYFYYRQQVSMIMAGAAACDQARASHRGLADGYKEQIASELSLRRDAPRQPSSRPLIDVDQ